MRKLSIWTTMTIRRSRLSLWQLEICLDDQDSENHLRSCSSTSLPRKMLVLPTWALLASAIYVQSAVAAPPQRPCDSGTSNSTYCGADFCTWWHDSGEINTYTPVQPGNVRQSRKYSVQVSKSGANDWYNSFAYEAIPRNGNGRIYAPTDPPTAIH